MPFAEDCLPRPPAYQSKFRTSCLVVACLSCSDLNQHSDQAPGCSSSRKMGKTRGTLSCRTNTAVLDSSSASDESTQPSTSGRDHLEQCYAATSNTGTSTRYLCYFLHRLLNFRVPELTALADMFGVKDVRWEPPHCGNEVSPFWYVHLPSERAAHQIVNRAVLIRVSYKQAYPTT